MERGSRSLLGGVLAAMGLASALRFANLGGVPISLYCDEAFSGYEAYCLLLTGRDSRGVLLPFFFDIFGKGWGEPLYIYLTVPAVALFGLTPFAARFVAALAGTAAVGATGLLCARLAGGALGERSARHAGIAASFLMAISPWSFHLSRVAFQASLLPAALPVGFWLAARAMGTSGEPAGGSGTGRADRRDRAPAVSSAWLIAAAVLLGLSLYTYTIARLALPLLLAGFVWLHRDRLGRARRGVVSACLVLAAMAAPIAAFSLTAAGRQRLTDVSVLTRPDIGSGGGSIAAAVAGNYLSYFSPGYLLTEGDSNERHSIRGHGVLHPHDVALLGVGAVVCLAARSPGALFALWWLLAAPVPASLTADPRHAVRSIAMQPAVYVIAGIGVASIVALARAAPSPRRRLIGHALLTLAVGAAILPAAGYFMDYFGDETLHSGPAWQYGLREVYDYVEARKGSHDSVYITRYEDFPYIHLLFYEAFPPRLYQSSALSTTPYRFDEDSWSAGPGRLRPLFVWKPQEVPDTGVTVRHVIRYPDGSDAFVIVW